MKFSGDILFCHQHNVSRWVHIRVKQIKKMIRCFSVYHRIGVRTKMWMLGLKQPSFISPLNLSMAIDTGSELFCEVFIFTSCVCLLLLEVSR